MKKYFIAFYAKNGVQSPIKKNGEKSKSLMSRKNKKQNKWINKL
ncbi:hypothetical protein HJ01_01169 [Flavobacterium frigoris PS1]|uniref:Uncharacterized protein n=1 Tax=Flavobacterium frigoris (strain PS1) TaxID=1086011 RepID=H7FPQ9_FLAFP|nr:hypothetical protein HJ01_01169 [Flavobacterium frigoris PS1]